MTYDVMIPISAVYVGNNMKRLIEIHVILTIKLPCLIDIFTCLYVCSIFVYMSLCWLTCKMSVCQSYDIRSLCQLNIMFICKSHRQSVCFPQHLTETGILEISLHVCLSTCLYFSTNMHYGSCFYVSCTFIIMSICVSCVLSMISLWQLCIYNHVFVSASHLQCIIM